ncbi:MAG: AmmeMemoRadiSam system protein B [Candidatus Geothermincolia bacterium]
MDLEHPRLRALEPFPVRHEGQDYVALQDRQGYLREPALLPPPLFFVASLCDGKRSVRDLQAAYVRRYGDIISSAAIEQMLGQLDRSLLLDTPGFRSLKRRVDEEYMLLPNRPMGPAAAAYAADPRRLADELQAMLNRGKAEPPLPSLPRSLIAPHIDLARGARCYSELYSLIAGAAAAERVRPLVIILGTSHAEMNGAFALTSKNYLTPFGMVETDQRAAQELAQAAGLDGLGDEISHRSEHSIEMQLPLLVSVFGGADGFTLLPVTCGSLDSSVQSQTSPLGEAEVASFVRALSDLARSRTDCILLASADLAHVGPRFGGRLPLTDGMLLSVRAKDKEMLENAQRGDAEAFFAYVAGEGDARHICGLTPIYALVRALGDEMRLVRYDQSVEQGGGSAVTFAGLVGEG